MKIGEIERGANIGERERYRDIRERGGKELMQKREREREREREGGRRKRENTSERGVKGCWRERVGKEIGAEEREGRYISERERGGGKIHQSEG